ncbi:MAG TPA: signal peptidase II [candidate division Zixibacteria bacterium]|nr:signal peptidase II [candidate division Zixibacteria bacterium]
MNTGVQFPWGKIAALTAGVVILDRITKNAVVSYLNYGASVKVVGDFFRLTYVQNPGGAFGTRLGGNIFYIVAASIALFVLILWMIKHQHSTVGITGLALMLGGALGNLWDRFTIGRVIDFIDVGVGATRWPTFNIADSAITIGICLLIIQELFLPPTGRAE